MLPKSSPAGLEWRHQGPLGASSGDTRVGVMETHAEAKHGRQEVGQGEGAEDHRGRGTEDVNVQGGECRIRRTRGRSCGCRPGMQDSDGAEQ